MAERRHKNLGPPKGLSERRRKERRKGPKDRRSITTFTIPMMLSILVAVAALLGYIYTSGVNDSNVDNKLDRNCRILAILQADTRFLIIQHTNDRSEADAFREIFQKAFNDACGGGG